MPDLRDYKDFLRELPIDQFDRFVSEFGGGAKDPEEIVAWVISPGHEKRVCDKIRKVFKVQILTAAERQEKIAKASADATKRQATAAEKSQRDGREGAAGCETEHVLGYGSRSRSRSGLHYEHYEHYRFVQVN